ncbi:hypothetical protein VM636_29375 [Streptomyces sp. SCSIO 75703]|uniref:hypothetical protein n=1 Tax=unclassified Streptomyces TaxID=2593676 RepID=UPI00068DDE0B|nr:MULTISPECIES: hypothetical protein [unclassified Streptomyces]
MTVTEVFDRTMDVFTLLAALGCVALGVHVQFRPGQAPVIKGPVRLVRVWGLGYVLLGISLAAQTAALMTGAEPAWTTHVIRWVAGPLVVGSLLASYVVRRRARRHGAAGRHEPPP